MLNVIESYFEDILSLDFVNLYEIPELQFCPFIPSVAKYNLEAAAVLGQSREFSGSVRPVFTLSAHLISTPV